jgi:hypothetical protein
MGAGNLRRLLIVGVSVMLVFPTVGQAAAKYKEVEVSDGGSVTGKVSFEGALPEDAVDLITITKNPEVCDKDPDHPGAREVVWVDVEDGALRGVFVFIDKIQEGKKWPEPEGGNYVILQKGCRFRPWAQVIRRGPIVIRHSDGEGVLHNINDIMEEIKPRRSAYIAINCEAHNFMFGYMMAPTHPYAVVVAEDGTYSIDGIPPGKYTVKAWHPRFGVQKTKLEVPANGAAGADFTFSNKK